MDFGDSPTVTINSDAFSPGFGPVQITATRDDACTYSFDWVEKPGALAGDYHYEIEGNGNTSTQDWTLYGFCFID